MEKLIVKNFLVLKDCDFEIRDFNIIIGEQASGKSVLAKLMYTFRSFLADTFIDAIKENDRKSDLLKSLSQTFNNYFPKYAWKNQQFIIVYVYNDIEIIISKKNAKSTILTIEFCKDFDQLFKNIKSKFRAYKKKNKKENSRIFDDVSIYNFLHEKEEYQKYSNRTVFIPASRSFFANLQKNIFGFLSSNIDIDPFLKQFGAQYERIKSLVHNHLDDIIDEENKEIFDEILLTLSKTIKGTYVYEDEQDWIKLKNSQKINLSHSSSGQQESLPMLLVLLIYPFLSNKKGDNLFFIEEPEAHLFPTSQKYISEMISLLTNLNNNKFFITTHSPYILSAVNNFILAHDVFEEHGKEKLNEIINYNAALKFENISAYSITDGKLNDIKDYESRLVGINIIDSVSDDFSEAFDKLLNI